MADKLEEIASNIGKIRSEFMVRRFHELIINGGFILYGPVYFEKFIRCQSRIDGIYNGIKPTSGILSFNSFRAVRIGSWNFVTLQVAAIRKFSATNSYF